MDCRALPDRAIAITIDDAYRSVYSVVWSAPRGGVSFTVRIDGSRWATPTT